MSQQDQQDNVRRHNRITRVSGVMKWVLTIFMLFVLIVGILVFAVLLIPDILEVANEVADFGDSGRTYGEIPFMQRLALAIFTDLSIATFLITLWYMRAVFAGFQKLDFFSSETLSSMVWCGIWFVIFGIFDFLEEPVSSVLTTLDLGEGERQLAVVVEGAELFFIIFGIMFITIGWVMREAARINEENQQFI